MAVEFPILNSKFTELLAEASHFTVYDCAIETLNLDYFVRGHVMNYLETHDSSWYLRGERIYSKFDRKIYDPTKHGRECITGSGIVDPDIANTVQLQIYLGFDDPQDAIVFRLSI